MFLDWTIGYFSTWRIIALCGIIPCGIVMFSLTILPETPYWLIENDQLERAKKSLKFFRGSKYDVTKEIEEIHQKHISKERNVTCSWTIHRFFSHSFLKPFSCVGMNLIALNLTGFEVLITYMIPILEEGGFSEPQLGTVIAGGVRVLSAGTYVYVYVEQYPLDNLL